MNETWEPKEGRRAWKTLNGGFGTTSHVDQTGGWYRVADMQALTGNSEIGRQLRRLKARHPDRILERWRMNSRGGRYKEWKRRA